MSNNKMDYLRFVPLLCCIMFGMFYAIYHLEKIKKDTWYPAARIDGRTSGRDCLRHYYLCSIRKALLTQQLYGEVQFPDDVFNFSGIAQFETDFFKVKSFSSDRTVQMKQLQTYLRSTQKNKWLKENIIVHMLNSSEEKKECSFEYSKYFRYSFKYVRVVNSTPQQLFLGVYQTTTDAKVPATVLPNIHANIVTAHTVAQCTTIDYMNGTLNVACPLFQPEFTVTISGSYIGPSVNSYECPKNNVVILKSYKASVLMKYGFKTLKTDHTLNLTMCACKKTAYRPGFWLLKNGTWHWSTLHCYFGFNVDDRAKHILKSMRVILIGDSHVRFKKQTLVKHYQTTSSWVSITVPAHLAYHLDKLNQEVTNFSNVAIIINSGHWSMRFMDPATYISNMGNVYRAVDKLMKRVPQPQIVWLESTAITYGKQHYRWRTNSMLAAMNDLVDHNMMLMGIPILPAFDIAHPMNIHTSDGFHYAELYGGDPALKQGKVSVGGAIVATMVNKICSER